MSGRALPADLAAVRALVADGLAEMGDAGGTGQVWIRSACARLTTLDGVLTEAAGVLAAPVQVAAVTVATFLVVAGSAAGSWRCPAWLSCSCSRRCRTPAVGS
jgi:hypothetical protein